MVFCCCWLKIWAVTLEAAVLNILNAIVFCVHPCMCVRNTHSEVSRDSHTHPGISSNRYVCLLNVMFHYCSLQHSVATKIDKH